jgi:biofilm PGA synthesis N-glycosyltransferase PgaC
MEATTTDWLLVGIGGFCFGYPFVMAWYWMVGGLLFYITRERHMAAPRAPAANLNPGAMLQRR